MSRSSPQLLLALGVGLVATATAGCKPKAGEPCSSRDEDVCQDESAVLHCLDGKWAVLGCLGPAGCAEKDDAIACDQTLAQLEARCVDNDAPSCATDRQGELRCADGQWQLVASCEGPKGCVMQDGAASCDWSLATAGSVCREPAQASCAKDGTAELTCTDGTWQLSAMCQGPKGCVMPSGGDGEAAECDYSLATVGTLCRWPDAKVCATDHRAKLACADGKWAVASTCHGAKKCQGQQDSLACDTSVAATADPCDTADRYGCTADQKAVVRCRDGKFAVHQSCEPKQCRVSDTRIWCE